jgi:hypothetical protein
LAGARRQEAVTIRAIRITVYLFTFTAVIGIAAAIAWLSIVVTPLQTKQEGLTMLAIGLGGLAVAGGIVYLAEKLINLAKGVAIMLAEFIVEKYKKHRFELGRKEGLAEGRQKGRQEGREEIQLAMRAWYRRQQEALRSGLPFDEPPPGVVDGAGENGKEPD